jgi:hypothetical protein
MAALRGYGLHLETGGGILLISAVKILAFHKNKYLVQRSSRRGSQHGDILLLPKYSAEILNEVTLVTS